MFLAKCPPAVAPWACMFPYQGQLLSELDDHPLMRSGQGNEVKHNEAATQGEVVTRVSVSCKGHLEKQLSPAVDLLIRKRKDNPHLFQIGQQNSWRGEGSLCNPSGLSFFICKMGIIQ